MHVSYTTEEGVRSPDLWVSCQLDEIYNHKKKGKINNQQQQKSLGMSVSDCFNSFKYQLNWAKRSSLIWDSIIPWPGVSDGMKTRKSGEGSIYCFRFLTTDSEWPGSLYPLSCLSALIEVIFRNWKAIPCVSCFFLVFCHSDETSNWYR